MTDRPERSAPRTGDPAESLGQLAALRKTASSRRRVSRGGFIYRTGEVADPLFMVEEGLVKLVVSSPSGRDLTLGLFGPGEVFGDEAVLPRAERMSFAVAVEASAVLVIRRADVHALLERDPAASLFLTRHLAARIQGAVRQIEKFAWSPVSARLAGELLSLAGRAGVADVAGTRVDLRITHQDLANLIGSTRETTTATLNDFRRRGLIEFVKRQIVLLRPDQLSRLALQ